MKCFLTVIKKPLPSNALLIMKLTASFLLLFTLNVSAHDGYGQDKISLRLKRTEISDVLRTIEKQTNYRFLYNNDLSDIRDKITINVKDAELPDVLDAVLKRTRLLYQVMNDNLIVIKEDMNVPPDVAIQGTVTSDAGAPLTGASVLVKGTTIGTTTNADGKFNLNAPDANVTLIISSIGFDAQEIPLGGRTDVAVILATSTKVMDQVVVVGYGTQRRRAVTGAISSVSGDQLAKQPLLTPVQGIQGLAPGIQVTGSSQPGTQPRVTIRGLNTILTNENPLYVVDGVLTDDITNVNTSDVLSVDVLKDGAAAIYGSRAANGVILITTRKGRSGKANVSFDSYFGFRKLSNIVKMADRSLYLAYNNEARAYDGAGPLTTLDASANTDWYKEISRDGPLQNYNISISGGSENVTYLFSAGYLNDKGVLLGADYKRITLRLNNEYRVAKFLKFGNVVNASINKSTNKPNGAFSDAYKASPAAPLYQPSGNWGYQPGLSASGNPVALLALTNDFGRGQRFQGNIYGELTLLKGLTFRSTWGFDKNNGDKTEYSPVFSYGTFNKTVSELILEDITRFYWVQDNVLNYKTKFANDHNVEVTVGHSSEKDRGDNIALRATNVPPERNLWFITQGDPTITSLAARTSAYNLQRTSYFGRLSYSYKDKYNLSGVLRRDGSSAFPENQKWGTFYSVAGSWIVSEESFMENVKAFDFLKVRGGYAELGNDNISRIISNAELSATSSVSITNPYAFPGGLGSSITFNQIPDPFATWETTKSVDMGVEFGVLNRRLTGEISYYNKKTGAYIRVPIPSFADPNGILAQAADIRNKGFEFQLGWNDKTSNGLGYRFSANATINKNNVDKVRGGINLKEGGLGNGQVTTSTVEGKPIGSFWVYEVAGVFQTQAEVDAAPHITGTKPGDFRYTDFNKDNLIDERDRVFVGAYQPKFYYGINGGLNWKQLDFTIDCYGNAGNKVYNGKKAVRFGNENVEASRADRWTPSNHSTTEYRASNQIPVPSTYFVESGTFFRVNNVTIGYTLPSSLTDKAFISKARFFVSAQNPLISKKFSGFSPELQGTNALNSGIELSVYPIVATYMVGFNVNFK